MKGCHERKHLFPSFDGVCDETVRTTVSFTYYIFKRYFGQLVDQIFS